MDPKDMLLTEGLATARMRTLEGLRPIMDVHVRFEANLTGEDFLAAGMRTAEELCTFLTIVVGLMEFPLLENPRPRLGG